jgi:uncharacterized protein
VNSAAVIVFARAPRAGTVKTRLIPALGAAGAALLYEGLLVRTLQQVAALSEVTRLIFVDERTALEDLGERVTFPAWQLRVQQGATLGARMAHALATTLQHHARVILLGSDLVDVETADLTQALDTLAAGTEVVLGPAADGGYWLIGLARPQPLLFTAEIPWGSARVYADTVAKIGAAGLSWSALRARHDIDCAADLAQHAAKLRELLPESSLLAGELRTKLLDPSRLRGL